MVSQHILHQHSARGSQLDTCILSHTPIDPGLGDIHSLPLYTCLGNMNIHELTMIAGILLSRKAPFHVLGINILYFFHIHSSKKEVASIWIW